MAGPGLRWARFQFLALSHIPVGVIARGPALGQNKGSPLKGPGDAGWLCPHPD